MPAAKRLAHVVPDLDLGESTLHLSPQKANKAKPTMALKCRGDVTRKSKTWLPVALKKDVCVHQIVSSGLVMLDEVNNFAVAESFLIIAQMSDNSKQQSPRSNL